MRAVEAFNERYPSEESLCSALDMEEYWCTVLMFVVNFVQGFDSGDDGYLSQVVWDPTYGPS
jgi:hypothetical protein